MRATQKGRWHNMKKLLLATAFVVVAISFYMLGASQREIEIPSNYIDMNSEEFYNNFIDMREVWDFRATEDSFFLCLRNGDGYFWTRGEQNE